MTRGSPETIDEFETRWASVRPAVAAYIAALVPDFRDAQDFEQTIALACLRHPERFDPSRPFVRWVLGIARLEILNHRRRYARSRIIIDGDLVDRLALACESMAFEADPDPRTDRLRQCLGILEGRAALLVRLRYEEALSPSAIAPRLGLAPGAVRVALNRVRALLRACLQRPTPPPPCPQP